MGRSAWLPSFQRARLMQAVGRPVDKGVVSVLVDERRDLAGLGNRQLVDRLPIRMIIPGFVAFKLQWLWFDHGIPLLC
jgi:hypothetical protein